jgi:hypothetical protein
MFLLKSRLQVLTHYRPIEIQYFLKFIKINYKETSKNEEI